MRSPLPTSRVALLASALCWLAACDNSEGHCGPASDWPVWCPQSASTSDHFSADAGRAEPTAPGPIRGDEGESDTGGLPSATTGSTASTTGAPLGGITGESATTGSATGGTGGSLVGTTAGAMGATGGGGETTGGTTFDPTNGLAGGVDDGAEEPVDCLDCSDDDPDAGVEGDSSCADADECTQEVDLSGEEKSLDAGSMQLLSASVQWSSGAADELTVFVRGRDAQALPVLIVVGMRTPDGSPFAPGRYGPVPALITRCVGDPRERGMDASVEVRSLDVGFEGTLELRGADWNVAFDVEQPDVCEPPG